MAYADTLMQKAKAMNVRYKAEKLAPFKAVEELYAKDGSLIQAQQAQVNKARKRSLASGMQSLMSSGLSNTTMAAGLGKTFEEEVGVPAMLGAEADRVGRLGGAMTRTAGANLGLKGASVSVDSSGGNYLASQKKKATSNTRRPATKSSSGSIQGMEFSPLF